MTEFTPGPDAGKVTRFVKIDNQRGHLMTEPNDSEPRKFTPGPDNTNLPPSKRPRMVDVSELDAVIKAAREQSDKVNVFVPIDPATCSLTPEELRWLKDQAERGVRKRTPEEDVLARPRLYDQQGNLMGEWTAEERATLKEAAFKAAQEQASRANLFLPVVQVSPAPIRIDADGFLMLPLPTWEHLRLWLPEHAFDAEAARLGSEGWELCAVIKGGDSRYQEGPRGVAWYTGLDTFWKRQARREDGSPANP